MVSCALGKDVISFFLNISFFLSLGQTIYLS